MSEPFNGSEKTADKTADSSTNEVPLIPQEHGGALLAGGVPGNKGGTGRPSLEFKEWCASLLDDPEVRAEAEAVLKDKKHPAFKAMFAEVADRAKGKAAQSIDHTTGGKPLPAVTRVVIVDPVDGDG